MNTEHLKVLFETHPGVNEFLVTSDGTAFVSANRNYAESHASGLADKSIKEIGREDKEETPATNDPKEDHLTDVQSSDAIQRSGSGNIVASSDIIETTQDADFKEERKALLEKYKALFGKGPGVAWGVEVIKQKIAEKEAENGGAN